eukprot:scaffold11459_cov64-Phaeocystis_antarctica.AAC.9
MPGRVPHNKAHDKGGGSVGEFAIGGGQRALRGQDGRGEGARSKTLRFTCPYCPASHAHTVWRALNLFHQRYSEERCQYLRITETAGGGRWPCLNTRGGKRRRNLVVLRSAPAASFSRQLMRDSRSSRSAESCSALLQWTPNGATRVRYAQIVDSSVPAQDLSCRQRACRQHECGLTAPPWSRGTASTARGTHTG